MTQFGEQVDQIHARYRARFSGFPRITRDPEELQDILGDATSLAKQSLDGDERTRLETNASLYETELKGIKEARAQGPAALVTHRLSTWANFVQARYARGFAGKERRSRDLGMLQEMVDDKGSLHERMQKLSQNANTSELANALELTTSNLRVYRLERDRIREDRKRVFGPERGTLFANLANSQFTRYRLHFANKSRLSRNPAVLKYIISATAELLEGMESLRDDGFNTETHLKNIGLVSSNLEVYRKELPQIEEVQAMAPLADRVGQLGGAANEIFKTYRENFAGKNRKTRDLALLSDQLELLFQVGKQMDAIDRSDEDEVNAKNFALVMDMLYLYHREYNLVEQQKDT